MGLGFLGDLSLAVAAILGAAAVLGCVLLISRSVQSVMTLLILGLMFGYVTGAFVSVLIYFSVPEQIQSYILWTFGSFGSVTWRQMPVLISAIFLGLLLAFLCIKPLNALLLGENYARSMGLNVKRVRLWILISASILTGVTTAFCGPIAFLGPGCTASLSQSVAYVGSPRAYACGHLPGGDAGTAIRSDRPFAGQSIYFAAECGDVPDWRTDCDLVRSAPKEFESGVFVTNGAGYPFVILYRVTIVIAA